MDQPSSPELVKYVEGLINTFFDLPPEKARVEAAALVMLAEDWGSPELARNLDWNYRVKKDLGEKFRWRSPSLQAEFKRHEAERYKTADILAPRHINPPLR